MSLRERVQQSLVSIPSFTTGTHPLSVTEGDQTLACELVALDSLACAFDHFVLQTPALAQATVESLRALSDKLSRRLGYLLETIGAVETDAEQCVVQMRSTPPHQDDDGTSYYELLVRRGGELRLNRYRKTPGSERQVIPAHVTREVFLRLVADFSAAAQSS